MLYRQRDILDNDQPIVVMAHKRLAFRSSMHALVIVAPEPTAAL